MTTIEEMDEFVNWDNAAAHISHLDPSPGPAGDQDAIPHQPGPSLSMDLNSDPNFDLALENVAGDDFSFWALEHFSSHSNSFAAPDAPAVAPPPDVAAMDTLGFNPAPNAVDLAMTVAEPNVSMLCWETPNAPCDHCQRGGYQCKRIQEGKYKGYCTSCVALRCQCSFGFAHDSSNKSTSLGGATFPPNPWPTLGDHPDPIINYDLSQDLLGLQAGSSTPDPQSTDTAGERAMAPNAALPMSAPKIGARFSRESVKTLKNWLSTHSRHPYPTDEEKEGLVRQTGLSKLQITNWLANARRRGKIQAPRSTSPHVRSTLVGSGAGAIDIPRRRGTPSPLESMNPLQRWVESPPDHEPASVTDIARAITTSSSTLSSGLSSPYGLNTDDGSGKSLCNWSSASSLGTSHSSNNSFASAYSHGSRGSMGSINSFNRGRRRRRRRAAPRRPDEGNSLHAPLKTYQCTFCTLTFRTKHDWQRHEKSLHLSLERWVCAPDGPRALNSSTGQISCVFCGEANPDDAHIDSHNHSSCQDRSFDERTFYRKDHLRQHLKLVHNVKFLSWSMEPWKVVTPEIRSRCGFCGIVMDSWTFRVDHLAEHFKTGYSMADWKGDWGFEAPVLQMVENSIPPFLIHEERNSPLPYTPGAAPPESPRNAYELLKLELASYISNYTQDTGRTLSDHEIQHEACRIIFGAEVLSRGGISSVPSWLRDLIMSSPEISESARLGKVRSQSENRLSVLKINGKDSIFDGCPLEQELQEFSKAQKMLGLTAMDNELQEEACRIIGRLEEMSRHPADDIANWLVRLIYSSTGWLALFRQRAQLPRSEDVGDASQRSQDPSTIDSTIYNYSRLETELAEYVRQQRAVGIEPTDADLQRQGRLIIYEFDDAWNQTAADNDQWLKAFRQRHIDIPSRAPSPKFSALGLGSDAQQNQQLPTQSQGFSSANANADANANASATAYAPPMIPAQMSCVNTHARAGMFFLNDANCYRRLARELSRWVKTVVSPNNPNRHIPTDSEIQHQARWILYDDDDPWNQTAADNAEWLRRFKRDVDLLSDSGPGLPETDSWAVQLGGSGFAPPYVNAKTHIAAYQDPVPVCMHEGTKPFAAPAKTVNKFLEMLSTRFPPMPKVFCPRELESGLLEFTQGKIIKGSFPSDEELKQQARLILGTDKTPADDPVLLEGFKEMARNTPAESGPNISTAPGVGLNLLQPAELGSAFLHPPETGLSGQLQRQHDEERQQGGGHECPGADQIRVNMTEDELDNMVRDMNFELNSQAVDLASTTGLGLDQDFHQV